MPSLPYVSSTSRSSIPTAYQPIASWSDSPAPHGCITVYCGEVRLIDNIAYH